MSIRIEYPVWFILLCLLLGAALALVLYYRNRQDDFPRWLVHSLAILRFVSVSLISFLLLSPLIRTIIRTHEKPLIILGLDNSQSIRMNKDSVFYLTDFQDQVQQTIEELKRDYDLRIYSLGTTANRIEPVSGRFLSLDEKQTDLSDLFDQVEAGYSNRNIGAVILATDGIYNKGMNPLYSSQDLSYPLYTIALGDTSVQRDVILARVNYNRIAYLGNTFPIEIAINAHKFSGNRSRLTISKNDSVLFSRNIDFLNDHFSESMMTELKASQTGLNRYRVSLSRLEGEITYGNNTMDIFIEVLDSRQKILILYHAPHPDISAIKSAIQANINYEVEDMPLNRFNGELSGYNLLILHQIPARKGNQNAFLTQLGDSDVPVLFIIGNQSNLSVLNRLEMGLTVVPAQEMTNEARAAFNKEFMLFHLDQDIRTQVENFPPLMSPFGDYRLPPHVNVLMYQRIGKVVADLPLIAFIENNNRKTGYIMGEGVWKWRLSNYADTENHNAFDQTLLKIIQYLAVKEEKGFFNLSYKSYYYENEQVEMTAEVYDKSYELINTPDVEITIENQEGTRFPFVFGRKGQTYYLMAGNYPPGNYYFRARVTVGNEVYTKTGQFSVEEVDAEMTSTRADHLLLYNLASRHGGVMISPDRLKELPALLRERDDIKTLIYTRKSFNEFNNIIWVLVLIVVLLSTEWFLRKYKGSY